MKTPNEKLPVVLFLYCILFAFCGTPAESRAQSTVMANSVSAGTEGNAPSAGIALGLDFDVIRPVTIQHLGVFDHLANGIQGSGTLTVQLFAHNVNVDPADDSGTLLETLTFDAANPGALIGGFRLKPLSVPVTLLPGPYTITASGFDTNNPAGDAGLAPYQQRAPWGVNEGGGLVQFRQTRYGPGRANEFPNRGTGQANAYAAATFSFSAANLPAPAYASDYTELTAGITSFYLSSRRRTGSIALFGEHSFPILVEPSGNRLIAVAAGFYNDDPQGGRCVAFAHPQWGHGFRTPHARLIKNAIQWTTRKTNPAEIVVGLGPLLETNLYERMGVQIRTFPAQFAGATNGLPPCDVIVVDWHAEFDEAAISRMSEYVAHGGNLIVTVSPWLLVHGGIQPAFHQLNQFVEPFGLAYRPSTTIIQDLNFTNVPAQPYPAYFRALGAAQLLGQEKRGATRLTSLEKAIALNTINYSLNARPDLIDQLTAVSAGVVGGVSADPAINAESFSDIVVLNGAQALTNRLGEWLQRGDDLFARDRRGAVEYEFTTRSADKFKLRIEGNQFMPGSTEKNFDLALSIDGITLGRHRLTAEPDSDGATEALTPYLPAGRHTLRILWDNAVGATRLRLTKIRVQSGSGPDNNGNGTKDWVDTVVYSQSSLDSTNATLESYVSPFCLEGRDAYLPLIELRVQGSQNAVAHAKAAGEGRWYADVPLSPDQNTPLVLSVTYQNGARVQWRTIHWKPVNLMTSGDLTLRKGDSLLLTALPDGMADAPIVLSVGTNERPTTASSPLPFRFMSPGLTTVTGVYNGEVSQTRSIRVKVVDYEFPNDPAAWALAERTWDLPNVPAEVVLDADRHILFTETAALSENGRRISLVTDRNEPRAVLARLGPNGPVLDSAQVNGFEFWHGDTTRLRIVEQYDDGSQLVEMLLVLSPVVSGLTVQLDVIVGGVTFEDGSTARTLSTADFDALGQCKVRFLRPASAQTSVCHSIKIFQGTELVGYIR